MPGLMAVADHGAAGAHHIADHAVVDEPPGRLDASAHEGIRSAAQPQVLLLCQGDELLGLFHVHTQGLFRVHMLPVEQCLTGDLIVLVRPGQIQNDLHFGVLEGLIHVAVDFGLTHRSPSLDLLFYIGCALFRTLGDQVADAHQIQLPKDLGDIL